MKFPLYETRGEYQRPNNRAEPEFIQSKDLYVNKNNS